MDVRQLNSRFSIRGQVDFFDGWGRLPYIRISTGTARALISIYGGQVLSYWATSEADELMFLSNAAYFGEGKAIKGGAPVCWPWFGPDPQGKGRPAHGFVRNRLWSVSAVEKTAEKHIRITLGISDTPDTQALWPHAFDLSLIITVGDTLTLELITRNKGNLPCTITQALHTYFRVGDIHKVKVLGLEGHPYLDKTDQGKQKTRKRAVTFKAETDRIYTGVGDDLVIADAALRRKIHIASAGSKTAVVWNPWIEISKKSADLQDDDYLRFVCVETANAATDVVTIEAEGEYCLRANYKVTKK